MPGCPCNFENTGSYRKRKKSKLFRITVPVHYHVDFEGKSIEKYRADKIEVEWDSIVLMLGKSGLRRKKQIMP